MTVHPFPQPTTQTNTHAIVLVMCCIECVAGDAGFDATAGVGSARVCRRESILTLDRLCSRSGRAVVKRRSCSIHAWNTAECTWSLFTYPTRGKFVYSFWTGLIEILPHMQRTNHSLVVSFCAFFIHSLTNIIWEEEEYITLNNTNKTGRQQEHYSPKIMVLPQQKPHHQKEWHQNWERRKQRMIQMLFILTRLIIFVEGWL